MEELKRTDAKKTCYRLWRLAPTTHFVELSQAILFRGAGFGTVWTSFLALLAIGAALFGLALSRFSQAMRQG